MNYFPLFLVLIFLCSCDYSYENRVEKTFIESTVVDYSRKEVEVIKEPIVSLGIDEFWSSQKIESAKLYAYSNSVFDGNTMLFDKKGRLHPGVLDHFTKDLKKEL